MYSSLSFAYIRGYNFGGKQGCHDVERYPSNRPLGLNYTTFFSKKTLTRNFALLRGKHLIFPRRRHVTIAHRLIIREMRQVRGCSFQTAPTGVSRSPPPQILSLRSDP